MDKGDTSQEEKKIRTTQVSQKVETKHLEPPKTQAKGDKSRRPKIPMEVREEKHSTLPIPMEGKNRRPWIPTYSRRTNKKHYQPHGMTRREDRRS
jgi:hypothetical protein